MSKLLPQPGRVCSFLYPRHNFHGILSRLEFRRVLVTAVRDLRQDPLDSQTFQIQPLLKRGRHLVIGQDLDKNCAERSFYFDSMRSISLHETAAGTPLSPNERNAIIA